MDLAQAATEVLTPLGFEVLELTVSDKGRTPRLLVRIDRLDEGVVSVDDVALASETFGLELDRLDPFDTSYHLEVESPGAKRPLNTRRHFERFQGLKAKVRVGDEGFVGVIREVLEAGVAFDVDGRRRTVPLDAMGSARLAEWPSEPR